MLCEIELTGISHQRAASVSWPVSSRTGCSPLRRFDLTGRSTLQDLAAVGYRAKAVASICPLDPLAIKSGPNYSTYPPQVILSEKFSFLLTALSDHFS